MLSGGRDFHGVRTRNRLFLEEKLCCKGDFVRSGDGSRLVFLEADQDILREWMREGGVEIGEEWVGEGDVDDVIDCVGDDGMLGKMILENSSLSSEWRSSPRKEVFPGLGLVGRLVLGVVTKSYPLGRSVANLSTT